PIVLVGKSYWEGLMDWIKVTMLEEERNISPQDLDLFDLVETPEEAVEIIEEFYRKFTLKPNF
ncbi:LOG family protein, partial [Flavobacteriales bacterium]|nr:LOG family protein [Flavobacteriales bacterium]